VLGVPNFEADDVLATLATWGRNESIPVVVVTGDRDAFQLVEDPFVKVSTTDAGLGLLALRRAGISTLRHRVEALSTARRLARGHSDNLPACRAWGEDGGQAVRPVPRHGRPLRHLSDLTPNCARTWRPTRSVPATTRR